MPIKLYISQPMRGREYDDIIRERKQLIADAATIYALVKDHGQGDKYSAEYA